MPRFSVGGNYTWSELEGNSDSENCGSGPVSDNINSYPEYKAFAQHSPVGLLLADQTHKARLYVSYDQPLGGLGNLNITLLERFESGQPYSALGNVGVSSYIDNPGYETPPSSSTYYFSDRGEYRWDNLTATDLALNWVFDIASFGVFVQADVINLFDESAQINGSTAIIVGNGSNGYETFDPFTETPIEGVHWDKRASFGNATSSLSYQQPRTYQFSAGFRF